MPLPTIDWATVTDAELEGLLQRAATEQQNRQLPKRVEELSGQYLTSTGREPGKPWVQPAGGHDAYPRGWKVTHNGKEWESKIAANVWAPGADPNAALWRDLTAVPTPGAWTVGAPVTVGQTVTYLGITYRALQAHTTQAGWMPPGVPALWAPVVTGVASTQPKTTTTTK